MEIPFGLSRKAIIWLAVVAGALAFVVGAMAWRSLNAPTRLSVAVAQGSDDHDMMSAFARALDDRRASIRLDVVRVGNEAAAGDLLATGKADLAVVRPDIKGGDEALGITPLHRAALFLAAVGPKGVEDVAKLAGKRVALVVRAPGDRALLDRVLLRYDLSESVRVTEIATADAAKLIATRQTDAVAVVAAPFGRDTRKLLRDIGGREAASLKLLDIDEAESISEMTPALSEETIKAGSLDARHKSPAEDVTTIGIDYYLMAQRKLSRDTAATLTELLFKERRAIARSAPLINQMKGIDPDEAPKSAIPIHPGAIDYYAREQKTFLDAYGDLLWLGLFAMGGVSSFFTWLWSFYARRRRNAIHDILDRLSEMLTRARGASIDELAALELNLDGVVRDVIRHATEERTSTRTMSALMLAIESTRAAIGERLALIRK